MTKKPNKPSYHLTFEDGVEVHMMLWDGWIPVSKLKFMEKHRNVAGLQLCDIFTYPSHYIARSLMDDSSTPNNFHKAVGALLRSQKYDRSYTGDIIGYGIKHLP